MTPSRITGGRLRPSQLLLVVLGGSVFAVAVFWFFAQGPGARLVSPPASTIGQFTGTSDTVTDSFQVRDGWRLRWSTSGTRLAISIRGDRNFGTVVEVEEATTGVTSPPAGGTFHLEVRAEGPWTVTVLQGD